MELIQAIILGVIQGLTEWLPISSTAHLRVVPALAGWPDPGAAFTAVIQLGTLTAVFIYFFKDILNTTIGWVRGLRGGEAARTVEARLGWAVLAGSIPIVISGVLFKESIENELRSLYVMSSALIGMALVLAFAESWASKRERSKPFEEMSLRDGLWVGLFQCIALIPGASRSGSTMAGALFAGFDRATAARFSFLLSVPSVLAAGVFSLKEHHTILLGAQRVPVLVATIVSFGVGYASIAWLMRYLQKHSTAIFIGYRLVLGLILIGLLVGGQLHPMR